MDGITGYDAAATGAVLGQVQLIKRILPTRWHDKVLPLLALALGIVYVMWIRPGATGDWAALPAGLALGLAASGTFAAGRKYVEPAGKLLLPIVRKITSARAAPPNTAQP